MKILYHHRVASRDGQYVHIEELTNALKQQGHEIHFVAPAVSADSEFGSDGGLVAWLKRYIPGFIYELMELGYSGLAFIKLYRAARRLQPDFIYERYNLYLPAGIWVRKLTGLPLLLEVNSPLYLERKKYDGIAIDALAKWSERYVWQNADHLLPVTNVLAGHIRKLDVAEKKISVIHNGINLARFGEMPDREAAKTRQGLQGRLVLGFTGFVREWHGLDKVVDLLAEPAAQARHLLIVGDGPARESIERRARELGVSEQLTITGIVDRDAVSEQVSMFDIALQPDVTAYASPLKLFEYMALGRAIVAPDSDNIREVLRDGENALLFRNRDQDDLLDKIRRLCNERGLREQVGAAARETITREGYTWENNARRVIAIASRLISDRSTGAKA